MKLDEFFKKMEENYKKPEIVAELAELPGSFVRFAMSWGPSEGIGLIVNGHQETPSKEEIKSAKEDIKEISDNVKKMKIWGMITQLSDAILEDPRKNIPALFRVAAEERYIFSDKGEGYEVKGEAVANLSLFAFGETAKKSVAAFPIVLDSIGPQEKLAQIAQMSLSSIFMNTPKDKRKSLSAYLPQLEKKVSDPGISASVKEPLADMVNMLKAMK